MDRAAWTFMQRDARMTRYAYATTGLIKGTPAVVSSIPRSPVTLGIDSLLLRCVLVPDSPLFG